MLKIKSIMVSDGRTEREICLYHGDITDLGPDDPVDLLVVSAFPNNYSPTKLSLIGALFREGWSVDSLAKAKEIDLRTTSVFGYLVRSAMSLTGAAQGAWLFRARNIWGVHRDSSYAIQRIVSVPFG